MSESLVQYSSQSCFFPRFTRLQRTNTSSPWVQTSATCGLTTADLAQNEYRQLKQALVPITSVLLVIWLALWVYKVRSLWIMELTKLHTYKKATYAVVMRFDTWIWLNALGFGCCQLVYCLDPGFGADRFGYYATSFVRDCLFYITSFNILVAYTLIFQNTLNDLLSKTSQTVKFIAIFSGIIHLISNVTLFIVKAAKKDDAIPRAIWVAIYALYLVATSINGLRVTQEVLKTREQLSSTKKSKMFRGAIIKLLTISVVIPVIGFLILYFAQYRELQESFGEQDDIFEIDESVYGQRLVAAVLGYQGFLYVIDVLFLFINAPALKCMAPKRKGSSMGGAPSSKIHHVVPPQKANSASGLQKSKEASGLQENSASGKV